MNLSHALCIKGEKREGESVCAEMRSNQVRLNNGITIPVIGMGTFSMENDRKTTENGVHMALKV